jgi:diguanylate cyclase (GGDEF)-like protein/PAS domain S-box-containing protein
MSKELPADQPSMDSSGLMDALMRGNSDHSSVSQAMLGTAEILQRLIDIIYSPILVKDYQHRWVLVNEAMEKLQGTTRENLLGKTDHELMPREYAESTWEVDEKILRTGAVDERTVELKSREGKPIHMVTRKARLQAGEGVESAFVVVVVNDVTEFRLAEARARFLSLHDTLTGLPNRAMFYETLEAAVCQAAKPLVMLVDLDGFKAVNDTHGHAAGDELLCVVAQRLRQAVRGDDTVVRLGGDEFAVVLQNKNSSAAAVERVAAAICATLAMPVKLRSAVVRISASVGISDLGASADDAEELVRQADTAMYQVKRGGRCGYQWYIPEAQQQAG